MSDLGKTRNDAPLQARELLGVDDLGATAPFGLAEIALGRHRAVRRLELATIDLLVGLPNNDADVADPKRPDA